MRAVGSVHLSLAIAALLFNIRLCSPGSTERGRVADGGMVSFDSHARLSSSMLFCPEQRAIGQTSRTLACGIDLLLKQSVSFETDMAVHSMFGDISITDRLVVDPA
jgi:hypothetical protein